MKLHRVLADPETLCDGAVREAERQPLEHVALAHRQRLEHDERVKRRVARLCFLGRLAFAHDLHTRRFENRAQLRTDGGARCDDCHGERVGYADGRAPNVTSMRCVVPPRITETSARAPGSAAARRSCRSSACSNRSPAPREVDGLKDTMTSPTSIPARSAAPSRAMPKTSSPPSVPSDWGFGNLTGCTLTPRYARLSGVFDASAAAISSN